MNKLGDLTGFEKIQLLRDMHRAQMAEKSWLVYLKIQENDLLPRLKYHDHHCMFHALLQDQKRYQKEIELVWRWMQTCQYRPSQTMYEDMIACCVIWRDLETAKDLLQSMKAKKMNVSEKVHQDLLHLYALMPGSSFSLEGIDFWKDMLAVPGLRPSLNSFCRALELYAQVEDIQGIEKTFDRAVSTLSVDEKAEFEIKILPKLQVSYLSSLVKAKAYVKVDELIDSGNMISQSLQEKEKNYKQLSDIYNIILKMHHQRSDLKAAAETWKHMRDANIRPNVIHYGRMLSLLGQHKKDQEAKELFSTAVDDLGMKDDVKSKKYKQLEIALLEVYCNSENKVAAQSLYEHITKDQEGGSIPGVLLKLKQQIDSL